MDEATSHLDVAREQQVNAAIGSVPMTRIIVAHRPETILSADRVLVLAGGRIVDDLRTDEDKAALLYRKPAFAAQGSSAPCKYRPLKAPWAPPIGLHALAPRVPGGLRLRLIRPTVQSSTGRTFNA